MLNTYKSIMKKIIVLVLLLAGTWVNTFAQDLVELPMKGKYIYYSFENIESNSKRCLRDYFLSVDPSGRLSTLSNSIILGIYQKVANLNKTTFSYVNIKNTNVILTFLPELNYSCEGEINFNVGVFLPKGSMFFESNLLYSLITMNKFKVVSQSITLKGKLKFKSANEYNLIFTNFVINYAGMQGNTILNEVLNLEDVYAEIQKLGGQKNKMYDRGINTLKELDILIKKIAALISSEIIKTYEIDELD